jgi:hypothetical protein
MRRVSAGMVKEEFFFAKRTKNFFSRYRGLRRVRDSIGKSFCFFFQKKRLLASLRSAS